MKMSKTFRRKKLDNFKSWRDKQIRKGKIISHHPPLQQGVQFAELLGLAIGDGHIEQFPRVEKFSITLDGKYPYLIKRTERLIKKVFGKPPVIAKSKKSNAVSIYFYQKDISRRLGLAVGNRSSVQSHIPAWIWNEKQYLIYCVKGLFEAEGSLSIHLPTCTYNFQFCNTNQYLLREMTRALTELGYHPEVRLKYVRLRKKLEVKSLEKLLDFRK